MDEPLDILKSASLSLLFSDQIPANPDVSTRSGEDADHGGQQGLVDESVSNKYKSCMCWPVQTSLMLSEVHL